jgi:hypothetical protein
MRNARHFGTEQHSTRARALSRPGRTLRTVSLPVVLIPGAGGQAPVTIAAYSLGAFTAPLVWQRVPAVTRPVRG